MQIERQMVEDLYNRGLLPKANYSDLLSFLKTIGAAELGEMIALCESDEKAKLEYVSFILALVFMNEYEVDVFRDVDMKNLATKFYRQCIAEACERVGVWEEAPEEVKLIPAEVKEGEFFTHLSNYSS